VGSNLGCNSREEKKRGSPKEGAGKNKTLFKVFLEKRKRKNCPLIVVGVGHDAVGRMRGAKREVVDQAGTQISATKRTRGGEEEEDTVDERKFRESFKREKSQGRFVLHEGKKKYRSYRKTAKRVGGHCIGEEEKVALKKVTRKRINILPHTL